MAIIPEKEYHGVVIENYLLPNNVVNWLDQRVGSGKWFVKGNTGGQTIYFENERDHLLFLITWGQRG